MIHCTVQLRDRKFLRGYEFLSFAKIMDKNIVKKISINLICKYSQKFFDHAKQFATDTLKTASKRAIQKAAETIGDLFGSKIDDLIFKTSRQNNSETATNEHDKEIPKERYISPKERHKIIDDLRLIQ